MANGHRALVLMDKIEAEVGKQISDGLFDMMVYQLDDALARGYRAGRLAAAQILREQLTEATRPDQRMTLTIAITAVERGRNLTATEKMKNLMAGMAEFEREEEAPANAAKIGEGGE